MAKFYFDFNLEPNDRSDGGIEFPTLDAAVAAAAASLALTASQVPEGKSDTVVVVGDNMGPRARVSLAIRVETLR